MPTISELVKAHQTIKAFLEGEDDRLKPYREQMTALENACLQLLQEQGQQNAKTEFGTAYLSHTLSVKVDNRDTFLHFVVNGHNWNFLDARVLKEPVQEWIERNPSVSPAEIGLKTTPTVKCNIRKS
jgi:hypothetical protein